MAAWGGVLTELAKGMSSSSARTLLEHAATLAPSSPLVDTLPPSPMPFVAPGVMTRVQVDAVLEPREEATTPATDPGVAAVRSAVIASRGVLEGQRAEALRQAKWTFNAAIAAGALATITMLVTVGLALGNVVTLAAVTTLVTVLQGVAGGIFYKMSRAANAHLDALAKDSQRLESVEPRLAVIQGIRSADARDRALEELQRDLRVPAPS